MKKHYELVRNENGYPVYLNGAEYSETDEIAAVLVLTKNGKEVSRDRVITGKCWVNGTFSDAIKARQKK